MADESNDEAVTEILQGPTCGIIMPLSAMDGCTAEHWADVRAIIKESIGSIKDPIFDVKMVSDADEVGVIQKRIVQNVFLSDVVVCDVSARNANVMFELGMRLAFDRPAVIIKDDKTPYSFDTGVIEHINYPRDLRYTTMQSFGRQLADKVLSTYQKSKMDPDHSTFLRNFGTFKVATLHTEEIKSDQIVVALLEQMQNQIARLTTKLDRLGISEKYAGYQRGVADEIYGFTRKTLKDARAGMSEDSWRKAVADPSFIDFMVSKIVGEFPHRPLGQLRDSIVRALKVESEIVD